jgi:hypothetical protein
LDSKTISQIKQDVVNELHKFGGLVHCEVQTFYPSVNVYVKCKSINSAIETMEKLDDLNYKGLILRYFRLI